MTDFTDRTGPGNGASGMVRVWDPLVRLFHWTLVAAFAVTWLTSEDAQPLHEAAGYTVAGLVGFRLIWGLVGGRYARFAQFLRGPGETIAYLGDMIRGRDRRYLGHNPAGAAMIVALLVALSGTAVSGWLMVQPDRVAMLPDIPRIVSAAWADEEGVDGGYGESGGQGEARLSDVHAAFANLTLLLVALHVAGVAFASVRHRENLARAMVTGDKRAPDQADIP